ncbi:hypothetical protein SpCBS45565_g01128 [Spizellomyces sp. 'palustris']|nr:hypothetical protein SpCBS45565_g01128 [Spizellomyces sp. 'palustris']
MVIYHSSLASAVTKVAPDVINNGVQPRLFSFSDGTGPSDVNREILESYSQEPTPPELKAQVCIDDPAVLIYTSGTTGMPKAAVVSHGRHYLGGSVFATAYHVKNTDRIYCCLPLYHSSAAVIVMGMSFRTGATVILAKKFSASAFWDDCRRHNATAFQYIGELCRYLLNQPPKDNDKQHNVRLAIGNGLRPDIWMAFRERFGIKEIGEFYASTEGNTTLFNWNHGPDGAGAVGHAGPLMRLLMTLRLVKLDIVTEEPARTPDGFCVKAGFDEPGELIGEIIPGDPRRDFKGYHGDKKATEKKVMRNVFKQGDMWFRTGDVLRMDQNGYYYFMDRLGDTFRWKGENVSTTEVQEAILTYPGVKEANVYGVPIPEQDGKAGMGSLVVDDSFDIKGLAAHLGKTLPKYAVPIFLRIQESITVTATFKHLKHTLRQEGYNPNAVKEPLFYQPQALNLPVADSNGYVPFGKSEFEKLIAGATKAKL